MNIVLAKDCTVINVWQQANIILNFPVEKELKYSLDRLKTSSYYSNPPPPRKYRERLSCQKTIASPLDNGCDSKCWKRCAHCAYKTRYLGNLRSHIMVMHSHDRQRIGKFEKYHYFQCALCPYGSKQKQSLKNHMIARHCERTDDECPRCHTVLKNRLCVQSHLQYCGKKPAHLCQYCPFRTRYRAHLARHISNVHTDCNTVECPNNCGSILKNKESLRGHLNFCGTELFSVQCRYCPFRPKRHNLLRLHELRVHTDVNNITNQCPKCTKKFKKGAYLKRHIENCNSKVIFQCDTCSYSSQKKDLLEKHIRLKHLDSSCSRCGTGFKNQKGLSEHLIRCGDKVGFQCYHCPFKTKIKDQLKDHILCVHIESNQLHQINMTNYITNEAPMYRPFRVS